MTRITRVPSRFIGYTTEHSDIRFWRAIFSAAGIKIRAERCERNYKGEIPSWAMYARKESDVFRAREIKRGFRVAQTIRGDIMDFLAGLRAGMMVRGKDRFPSLPPALDQLLK